MLKVFLADDSQLVRDRLREVFAEKGSIDVIGESGDAAEAMQAIQQLDPDVAILDIRMPGGGGLPILTHIKSRKPSQIVIVLTAYPNPQYRQAFMAAGADYFFDKTRDIQRMSDVLVELAQQRSGKPKKKVLVLGDNPASVKAAEIAIEAGRKVVSIVTLPPSPSQMSLVSDPYDLVILVSSSTDSTSVEARTQALLPQCVGRVPVLIVSHHPCPSDADRRIYHLGLPFVAHELEALVRKLLQENPDPAAVSARDYSHGRSG